MGSNYTLLIRLLLGLSLIIIGANQFVHFSSFLDFTGELLGLNADDLFYGALFIISGALMLASKAIPVALIILAFLIIQIFFYLLTNNPRGVISPMGAIGLLVLLNILDNRHRFKQLFY